MAASRLILVPNRLLGVDLASFQHPNGAPIDYDALAAGGVVWAYVKEGEDRKPVADAEGGAYDYYSNPYFEQDVLGCIGAGMLVGVYRFVRPTGTSPAESVTRMEGSVRRVFGDNGLPNRTFAVCDFEEPSGGDQLQWLSEFDNTVRDSPYLCKGNGAAVWNYSGETFLDRHGCLVPGSTPTQYNYIHAAYQKNIPPAPKGYTITAWQYNDKAELPGILGLVDVNAFFGSMDQLAAKAMP